MRNQDFLIIFLDASKKDETFSFIKKFKIMNEGFKDLQNKEGFWVIFVLNKIDLEDCILIDELSEEIQNEKFNFKWHIHEMSVQHKKGEKKLLDIMYRVYINQHLKDSNIVSKTSNYLFGTITQDFEIMSVWKKKFFDFSKIKNQNIYFFFV